MTDHRRLQRTLFRMQMDARFAEAILAGNPTAVASTGLRREDLELLLALDPAGLDADPDERRLTQVLGNIALEFTVSLALFARERDTHVLRAFASSAEFHSAVRDDQPLPTAFTNYLSLRAKRRGNRTLQSVLALETMMMNLRRRIDTEPPTLAEDEVLLAPGAHIESLPEGLLDLTTGVHEAMTAGAALPAPRELGPQAEPVLFVAKRARRHALAELHTERLAPPTDELLEHARRPLGREARAEFAESVDAEPLQLEEFVAGLCEDGILIRGPR